MAVIAEAIIFVETTFTHVDTLAVTVENFPSFRSIILALLTEFAVVVVAIVTEKLVRKFTGAGNTKSVGADIENLEVVLMVSANRNFGVEVGVAPVAITAKATAASDVNAMVVTAIFFGLPEIRNALKRGKFTLNQIPVEFRFSLSPTGAAVSVIESTLEQKSVVGLVHEKLTSGLAVVESFGIVRIGGSENDKGHVVTSVAGAPTVVVTIHDVEGMAGGHSRAAIISFRVAHRQEMRGINRHKKLEVNFARGKLVGELREEMLK